MLHVGLLIFFDSGNDFAIPTVGALKQREVPTGTEKSE